MPRKTSRCAPSRSASGSDAPDASREGPVIAAEPIGDAGLRVLFAPLEPFPVVILGVSGGSDSIAMMHLVARWQDLYADQNRLILVATVDHGLRPESASEAAWVARQARGVGFAHETLQWEGEKPATGLQDGAREARYRLLAEMSWRFRDSGPVAIVTAHTEDDQAETFLMRLARGSGLDGLTGISPSRFLNAQDAVTLIRPLLGVAGARLAATLESRGLSWIEDPSNESDRFERVRLRKARAHLEQIGLTNEKIALSARRLERAHDALEAAANALQSTSRLDVHEGAFASLDATAFLNEAVDLRLRLLARLIAAFGGQEQAPRLSKLEGLIERLEKPNYEATLGGCIVAQRDDEICVFREPGRAGLPEVSLNPGTVSSWDRRFQVWASPDLGAGVNVRALGGPAFAKLRKQLDGALPPARAAATLPSFWQAGELLAVPQLDYMCGVSSGGQDGGVALCWAKFLW